MAVNLGKKVIRQRMRIAGRVQGVGFRPAIYKLACLKELTGFVLNDSAGVGIEVQGDRVCIEEMAELLRGNCFGAEQAFVKTVQSVDLPLIEGETKFRIIESRGDFEVSAEITADMNVCGDCLREMRDPADGRYGYPFINCTNCGPRYSIVKTVPYDRCNTTMSVFGMCDLCAGQYEDVYDRRFHAQPAACGACGPGVWFCDSAGTVLADSSDLAIETAAEKLNEGKIVAIKGLGGFHLCCDASNEKAVQLLRKRKRRDHKPFAVMTDTVEKAGKYIHVDKTVGEILTSTQRPIVLGVKKGEKLAPSVTQNLNTLGLMLCYTPLHYLLFEQGPEVLVATSGNISDEPLICHNKKALSALGDIADYFLMHNRDIYRQVDDSVVHFITEKPAILRRSRGYVPAPIYSDRKCDTDIIALGADLKNTFCLVKNNQLICSEHIGDLQNADVYRHYIRSIDHFCNLYNSKPRIAVCDLHPNYFSSRYAAEICDAEIIKVQHHWAHAASVLAENKIEGPVIGLICDGTGFGTDGAIWGCECLIASLDSFERFGALKNFKLPGGDSASREALRPLLSVLLDAYGGDIDLCDFQWLIDAVEPERQKQSVIFQQLKKDVNCVESSSLGRFFDAAAALIGIGNYNNFDAELPMKLEAAVDGATEACYEYELFDEEGIVRIDFGSMVRQMVEDRRNKCSQGQISTKFHNTICSALCDMAISARKGTSISTVALSGGVFCNRYLAERLIKVLNERRFCVLWNRCVPSNDGGVSLGQAAIAMRRACKS
jgi:hydrogenase maturation protein HypF